MQNRGINYKQYGFMLWGGAIGYASLPKTFTNLLYSNDNIYKRMDDFLFSLHRNIELQRPAINRISKKGLNLQSYGSLKTFRA